jgi:hypothetical protein
MGKAMDMFHAAVFFAVVTGIVSSGFVGALWEAFSDEAPRPRLLTESGFLTPVKVLVVVFTVPTMILSAAFWWLIARPPVGLFLLIFGLLLSFVQGVFILTQLFHVT